MRKFTIELPTQVSEELERASMEVNARQAVIDRFLERHIDDSDGSAIDSKPFQYFMSLLAQSEAEFNMAKDEVTREYIPAFLENHEAEWSLDFSSHIMTITVKCDCDIPELKEYI